MKDVMLSRVPGMVADGPNDFVGHLPAGFAFPELSGAEVKVVHQDWGEGFIQEYRHDNFIIRYSVYEIATSKAMSMDSNRDFVHAIIMLKGTISSNSFFIYGLREGQFCFFNKLLYPLFNLGHGTHIIIELMIGGEVQDKQERLFHRPGLKRNDSDADYVSEEIRELIRYILSYDGPEEFRNLYFELKVKDIFFQLFLQSNREKDLVEEIPIEQLNKACAAERIIMNDLANHHLIRELSRKVQTSETILKRAFKKVFGMGMHEYLVHQRLIRANNFLQKGHSVKETAANLGWRSADLIKAYYKRYGTTPGAIKRKRNF